MGPIQRNERNEKGFSLITVLLVIALLTILGISATTTSTVEQRIATNDRDHLATQCHTDAGFAAIAKLVNQVLSQRTLPDEGTYGLAYSTSKSTVYDQIKYPSGYDDGDSDFTYTMDGTSVNIDIHQWWTGVDPRGGMPVNEFITGNKSAATGGGGGAVKVFRIAATGTNSRQTTSTMSVNYINMGSNNAGGL